jgi:hypothetical protein
MGLVKSLETRVKLLQSLLTPEQMLIYEKMNAESGTNVDEEDVSLNSFNVRRINAQIHKMN